MKALVLNAVGRRFDFENVDIVRASGLCHTDLLTKSFLRQRCSVMR